jgi:hypothetical protein
MSEKPETVNSGRNRDWGLGIHCHFDSTHFVPEFGELTLADVGMEIAGVTVYKPVEHTVALGCGGNVTCMLDDVSTYGRKFVDTLKALNKTGLYDMADDIMGKLDEDLKTDLMGLLPSIARGLGFQQNLKLPCTRRYSKKPKLGPAEINKE